MVERGKKRGRHRLNYKTTPVKELEKYSDVALKAEEKYAKEAIEAFNRQLTEIQKVREKNAQRPQIERDIMEDDGALERLIEKAKQARNGRDY